MQEKEIEHLKEALEQAIDRKLQTPKDFNFLSDCIFEKLHEHISPTTLKRMWGYINDAGAAPRKSTLDILARFLNYADWSAFCTSLSSSETASPSTHPSPLDPSRSIQDGLSIEQSNTSSASQKVSLHRSKGWRWGIALVFIVLVLGIIFGLGGFTKERPILHQGQTFATYDDYLSIFGLKSDADHDFFIRLPDYEFTILWAPRYKHSTWHNEGDSAAFLPTITEYYHPADYPTDTASMAEMARINKERYIKAIRSNEIRLVTFYIKRKTYLCTENE